MILLIISITFIKYYDIYIMKNHIFFLDVIDNDQRERICSMLKGFQAKKYPCNKLTFTTYHAKK